MGTGLFVLYTIFVLPAVLTICWKMASYGSQLSGPDLGTSFFGILLILAAFFIAAIVLSVWFRALETLQGHRESYTHARKDSDLNDDDDDEDECECDDEGDEPRCGHDCGCRKKGLK